jgi:hypothetical protein
LEIVLHMALAANKRAHFLTSGHGVYIVIWHSLRCFQGADAGEKTRARNP